MNFDEIVKERHSCRTFLPIPISDDVIKQIVEAGRVCPSAKNSQPWKFVCIKTDFENNESSKKISKIMADYYLKNRNNPEKLGQACSVFATSKTLECCPAMILVFEDSEYIDREKMESISDTLAIGACVEQMVLKATELGLGSLWIADTYYVHKELGEFIEEYMREKNLDGFVNEKNRLMCAIALGEQGEPRHEKSRKTLDDILMIIKN